LAVATRLVTLFNTHYIPLHDSYMTVYPIYPDKLDCTHLISTKKDSFWFTMLTILYLLQLCTVPTVYTQLK